MLYGEYALRLLQYYGVINPCQKFPDEDYWIEFSHGRFKVKPKPGFENIVIELLKKWYLID